MNVTDISVTREFPLTPAVPAQHGDETIQGTPDMPFENLVQDTFNTDDVFYNPIVI